MAISKKTKDIIEDLELEGYTVIEADKRICTMCEHEKRIIEFYSTSSKLYSSGKMPICKKCLMALYESYMTVNNYDEKFSMYELCGELNIIWVEAMWESSVNSKKTTVGTYIGKINSLPQYSNRTYKDSDLYDNDVSYDTSSEHAEKVIYDKFFACEVNASDLDYLTTYYNELLDDFNITTANHKDYAKKICVASLAMNKEQSKILTGGGSDTRYDKFKKIFDDLSTSAKFSEKARTKAEVGNGLSEIVHRLENKEWIPSFDEFEPDEIDKLFAQFQNIEKSV